MKLSVIIPCFNEEKTIAYPGSLIQQGFAEEPAH